MIQRHSVTLIVYLSAALLIAAACTVTGAGSPTAPGGAPTAPGGAPGAAGGAASQLADGTFIREANQPTIWVMQQGKRRAFPAFETFEAWGGARDLSNIRLLTAAELSAIPVGDTIPAGSRPPGR